jgi:hypothetical protein
MKALRVEEVKALCASKPRSLRRPAWVRRLMSRRYDPIAVAMCGEEGLEGDVKIPRGILLIGK